MLTARDRILRELLCNYFPSVNRLQILLQDFCPDKYNFILIRVQWAGSLDTIVHSLLEETHYQGCLNALISGAIEEYPKFLTDYNARSDTPITLESLGTTPSASSSMPPPTPVAPTSYTISSYGNATVLDVNATVFAELNNLYDYLTKMRLGNHHVTIAQIMERIFSWFEHVATSFNAAKQAVQQEINRNNRYYPRQEASFPIDGEGFDYGKDNTRNKTLFEEYELLVELEKSFSELTVTQLNRRFNAAYNMMSLTMLEPSVSPRTKVEHWTLPSGYYTDLEWIDSTLNKYTTFLQDGMMLDALTHPRLAAPRVTKDMIASMLRLVIIPASEAVAAAKQSLDNAVEPTGEMDEGNDLFDLIF